jgi:opacity protein-like surface antigen
MIKLLRYFLLMIPFAGSGQRLELDLSGGISNYQGDLQPLVFTLKGAKLAGSATAKYAITPNIFARAGFTIGALSATDANNRAELQARNLNFRSSIKEVHAGVEYRFLKPERIAVSPYVFIGVGVFMFNPYTFTQAGEKKYLQPLGTEGQGLQEYPDRKSYRLTQFSIPYGFGIKWQVNCNLNVGVGFRQAKTFTDYLDDVSTGYVNEAALRNARGQTAVDLAWRRNEYDGTPYPPTDLVGRGNPKEGDWYYFADFTIGLKINDCETGKFSLGGIFKNMGNGNGLFRKRGSGNWGRAGRKATKRGVACPKF